MSAPRGRRAHAGPPADEHPRRVGLIASANSPRPAPGPGGRLRQGLRPRTVRAKILSVLMVPVVSLMALWAFATVTTAQEVSGLLLLRQVEETLREPVSGTVTALQAERAAAARYLAAPTPARAAGLARCAGATERAAAVLRLGDDHTVADGTGLPPEVALRVGAFVGQVQGLRELRHRITARAASWDEAYDSYTGTVGSAFAVGGALASVAEGGLASDARVVLELARAGEMLAREDTLITTAQLTGGLSGDRYRDVIGAVQGRRTLLDASGRDLDGADRTAWDRLARSAPYGRLTTLEDRVLGADPGRAAADAAPAGVWTRVAGPVRRDLRAIEAAAGASAAGRADPFARGVLTPSGAAVLLGLLAVLASLFVSVRIGRGLVVELVDLRNTALELARRKLPLAMRRLRAGEEIDLDAEAPLGTYGADEIGQVGEALGTVQRSALRAAMERAELLSGVSGVFVNLARRSQVLVHRQLALLDSMERRTEDPGELEDLFRLDHLTTRMRRHAEGLIILSGAAPGRAWRKAVPLTTVVRAAVAEVEEYARVEVRRLPRAAVIGGAVADLTHLIAELVENATHFSPPHTKVRVYGEQVGNGYALEVEDRGLGMGKEAMAEANRRIEQSQALDLFDSDRLGLFVVSRLSKRLDVRISLRPSPYGGTTAVVLLPNALLDPKAPADTAPADVVPAPADRADRADRVGRATAAGPGPDGLPVRAGALRRGGRREPAAARDGGPPDAGRRLRAAAGPGTVSGPGTAPAPAPADAPSDGAEPSAVPPGSGGRSDELPRRVRRASLAPQLLDAPPIQPHHPSTGGPAEPERSPEQARNTMAAYRSGWIRGGGAEARDVSAGRRPGKPSREGDQN